MKSDSEGNTSQKMLVVSCATRAVSCVSTYSQTSASTKTSGTEAISPPNKVLRLAISAAAMIRMGVSSVFNA